MSKILDTVHESAKNLHKIGIIDNKTMREYDSLCLKPIPKLSPAAIKKIRTKEKVSQPIFAKYLNVSPSTIKKWETGEKQPSGMALRLLSIVNDNGLQIIH